MAKSPIKKDLDLLLKFLIMSDSYLPDFHWDYRRPEADFKTTYHCAWKYHRKADYIWEKLSKEGKDRCWYLREKPYKRALKKGGVK